MNLPFPHFLSTPYIDDGNYHPSFYRLHDAADKQALEVLLKADSKIKVHDELEGQLRELLKSRNPQVRPGEEELTAWVKTYLGDTPLISYGVWVYYPWSGRLVHLLDEAEFIEVRTNRNQYKITKAERDLLGKKKIGVIGLSVGKTISMAMALERGFGEIRLADFDRLELTNLNRIQTGVKNLGIPKAIAVAREIAEMDPFLKTSCYCDGLTRENMDDFFLKGGKLDILVEECDGLDIKIICRQKAKALGIPVVMDMNDRGTLDVERFDLEPNRTLLHGMIDHLDISQIGNLSNEEKIPFILPMLGEETISAKLKASMLEIGQSLSTWPQLGSSVVMGGALVADVCRRISLDQFHQSGRYFVDLEEQICDPPPQVLPPDPLPKAYTIKEMQLLLNPSAKRVLENQIRPAPALIRELVTAANLAPSEGNRQPWQWLSDGTNLYLFADPSRSAGFIDYQNTVSIIGLGAATENLVLKAHAIELKVSIETNSLPSSSLIVTFRFFSKSTSDSQLIFESPDFDSLHKSISLRQTGRVIGERKPISHLLLDQIQSAAKSISGAHCTFLVAEKEMQEAAEIIGKMERIRMLHKAAHADFMQTMRWTTDEAKKTKDGIDFSLMDLAHSERANYKMSRTPEVIQNLRNWKGGGIFERFHQRSLSAASAIGIIQMPTFGTIPSYLGGRALERAWLTATQHNIAFQPVSSSLFLFSRLIHGKGEGLNDDQKQMLAELYKRIVKLFHGTPGEGEMLLFRLSVADRVKGNALRRSLDDVLFEI